MENPLSKDQRDKLIEALRVSLDFFFEYAPDAELFALLSVLGNQSAQLANRIRYVNDCPPPIDHDALTGSATANRLNEALRQDVAQAQIRTGGHP